MTPGLLYCVSGVRGTPLLPSPQTTRTHTENAPRDQSISGYFFARFQRGRKLSRLRSAQWPHRRSGNQPGSDRRFLVIDGRIAEIGTEPGATPVDREVDCTGFVISPGWTDMHVHLRVPGQEYKETIETGTAAAAAGGFTAIAVMPNTEPALDSLETIGRLLDQCRERAAVRVMPIGAITIGRAGNELVDFEALANFGVVGFSDDGISTANSALMAEALVASTRVGRPSWSIAKIRTWSAA